MTPPRAASSRRRASSTLRGWGADRAAAGVREHDRRARVREQLPYHGVGGVGTVEHETEAVAFAHHFTAQRTEAAPFRPLVAGLGRVGEVVVPIVHESEKPRAEVVESLQQRGVLANGVAVLDTQKDGAPAFAGGLPRVVGGQRQGTILRMTRSHLPHSHEAAQGVVAYGGIAGGRARALINVHREHAGRESALAHAREIHLGKVRTRVVPLCDIPAWAAQTEGGRVEVRIDGEEARVQGRGARVEIGFGAGEGGADYEEQGAKETAGELRHGQGAGMRRPTLSRIKPLNT